MKSVNARLGHSLFLILAIVCLGVTAPAVFAQDEKPAPVEKKSDEKPAPVEKKAEQINLDTQLYLIVGTNQEVTDPQIPPVLEPVIKELRSSLPFKHYRLSATLINRVKSDGRLDLRWIGGPLLENLKTTAATVSNPTFSDFFVRQIRLVQDGQGRNVIHMDGFKFGSRIPIQTTAAVAGVGMAPSFNYESTGLTTDISMREGEPVIVGTLNVGPSGDAIILIVSARRALK
jgi:hypothetical protein